MAKVQVFGEGGYDPDKPHGNVVEEYETDDGDQPPTVADVDDTLSVVAGEVVDQ